MGVSDGLYMYDVVVKTFTLAISSTDEFLLLYLSKLLEEYLCFYLTKPGIERVQACTR